MNMPFGNGRGNSNKLYLRSFDYIWPSGTGVKDFLGRQYF